MEVGSTFGFKEPGGGLKVSVVAANVVVAIKNIAEAAAIDLYNLDINLLLQQFNFFVKLFATIVLWAVM